MTTAPINAFYEAVFITDQDFIIQDCNTRAVEIFRAASPDVLIHTSIETLSTEGTRHFSEGLRSRLSAEPFILIECKCDRLDGSSFIGETAIHCLGDHILFTIRDISRRVEALRRLEAANERLRATNRDRLEFVSNVSHELRTPLTSMSYALTNMSRGLCGPLPEKAKAYIERLQVDTKRLMTTVNDILDLRQIENQTITLNKTRVPLSKLLEEVVSSLLLQAEAKRQTVQVSPLANERYTFADRARLERVCFNIVGNAIKYTPEGGNIHASVKVVGDAIAICVDDTGIGIPPEALPRISQRYFRVGAQVSGTGLGLSIVREIVELHHGSFKVESPVPGTPCGTRVTVAFPSCEGPLEVVVSADDAFIETVSKQAETLGYTLTVDREGLNMGTRYAEQAPARFTLDGSLPEAYLNDLIFQIRDTVKLAQTPIRILTSTLEPEKVAEYARLRVALLPL